MLAILIAYRNGNVGQFQVGGQVNVRQFFYIMKVLRLWLASKVWLLVITVDESFHLIMDIQDLENPIGMLVCLLGLALIHGLQDIRSCMHLSGPKRAPLSYLGLRTVSLASGPA